MKARAVLVLVSALVLYCTAEDLILTDAKLNLGGNHTYGIVRLTRSTITVPKYNNKDPTNTGTLTIYANSFEIDVSSVIDAKGAGWQTPLCSDGLPATYGGAGGCSVRDSGGGGGHIGAGGYGTIDCNLAANNGRCKFPQEFEQTCFGSVNSAGTACTDLTDCRTYMGEDLTNGEPFIHSVYDFSSRVNFGFGGSGGDKGCRDGDGWSEIRVTGGSGGGRISLITTGTMNIYGKVTASGYRGCGLINDSGGGGAGGTILLIANQLNVYNSTSKILATGGRGGDSQPKLADDTECDGTQTGGTCDDCGGGGGGGLIYILAPNGNWKSNAGAFNVSGAYGGSCIGCENEAKGLDGWVQYGHEGELCNGVDDTYDGEVDEGFPDLPCGKKACINGEIQTCPYVPPSSTGTGPAQTSTTSTQTATGTGTGTGATNTGTGTGTGTQTGTATGTQTGNTGTGTGATNTGTGTGTETRNTGTATQTGTQTGTATGTGTGTATGTQATGTGNTGTATGTAATGTGTGNTATGGATGTSTTTTDATLEQTEASASLVIPAMTLMCAMSLL